MVCLWIFIYLLYVLCFSFSNNLKRWGFERVTGDEPFLYICEVSVSKLHYLVVDDRDYQYGVDVEDPEKVPRGPYFIKQPTNVVFDLSKRRVNNYVSLRFVHILLRIFTEIII